MKRLLFVTTVAAALLAGSAAPALAQVAPAAAVADATRPATDTAKDADRHPAELIAFMGVKPGMKVMDVWTGSGYWARLFSKVVGPKGHVYAYVPAEIAEFKSKPFDMAKAMAAEPGLGNVEAVSDPLASAPPAAFKNTLDVVWIFENYHDLYNPFMKGADVAAYNKAIFDILKPGGVYVDRRSRGPRGLGPHGHQHHPPHRSRDGEGRGDEGGLQVRGREQGLGPSRKTPAPTTCSRTRSAVRPTASSSSSSNPAECRVPA